MRSLFFVALTLFIFSSHSLSAASFFQRCVASLAPEHYRAPKNSEFPHFVPRWFGLANKEGLVITTKEIPLTSQNILDAYNHGVFPWNPKEFGTISWYNPKEHGVVMLDKIIERTNSKAKGLTTAWRKAHREGWKISYNRAFEQVIENCKTHDRANYSHVWLTEEVKQAFMKLHREGHAFSVEVWNAAGELIGGTYGIYQKGVFSAESMFHKESAAGKVAVIALAERLHATGHRMIDSQTVNDNTRDNYYAFPLSPKDYIALIREEERRTQHIVDKTLLFAPSEPMPVKELRHPQFTQR